ncbi:hypothetical protein HYV64_00940 [Candidatus Shapirobacteria bacterium]|nr:hypothetical protein [Candidatus Shapirobacteria bacterium]
MTKHININGVGVLELFATPTISGNGREEGLCFVENDGVFFVRSSGSFGGKSDLHPLSEQDIQKIVKFFEIRQVVD